VWTVWIAMPKCDWVLVDCSYLIMEIMMVFVDKLVCAGESGERIRGWARVDF